MNNTGYVLVTPARNEEAYIDSVIKSVVSQKLLPLKWVIVSDGSTYRTDEIVSDYERQYKFIQLVRNADSKIQHFGVKAVAFNDGYAVLKGLEFDFIGNLDADVSFDSLYFYNILFRPG